MFVNDSFCIVDCRCRLGLLGNSSAVSGRSNLYGTVGPSYSLRRWDLFYLWFPLLSILTPSFFHSSSVSLSYFILAVPMGVCFGKYSCMSFPYPIALLNGTFFFAKRDDLWGRRVSCLKLTIIIIIIIIIVRNPDLWSEFAVARTIFYSFFPNPGLTAYLMLFCWERTYELVWWDCKLFEEYIEHMIWLKFDLSCEELKYEF